MAEALGGIGSRMPLQLTASASRWRANLREIGRLGTDAWFVVVCSRGAARSVGGSEARDLGRDKAFEFRVEASAGGIGRGEPGDLFVVAVDVKSRRRRSSSSLSLSAVKVHLPRIGSFDASRCLWRLDVGCSCRRHCASHLVGE